MRHHNLLTKLLIAAALLILAFPLAVSSQVYNRDSRYAARGQYDRRDARQAIARLENSSARLESDLNYTNRRRVLGIFELRTTDNNALAQVRDFRQVVRQLRNNSDNGRALDRSADQAQLVLDRGVQLDRYLRLRTGSTSVDFDLSELRSSLHILADAYGLSVPF